MHCGPKALTIVSFSMGAIALVTLALSVSTDAWLFTLEPVTATLENQTYNINMNIRSGLWRVCTVAADGKSDMHAWAWSVIHIEVRHVLYGWELGIVKSSGRGLYANAGQTRDTWVVIWSRDKQWAW
ncbi:Voltage-dependent calcium channel gamma-7 subunit [Mizuhopecten yessoensis]|uniref:Voltage-dependent calcium channel gamma-7 subunit n=1 Tax=Mizuhopecten yessoensis TaxID=6573 RepID=A0A210QM87_MIZYE|nr:Voltage-dependent calcium channel gamma-7 subunit [Mizuhopecten yessoensis]